MATEELCPTPSSPRWRARLAHARATLSARYMGERHAEVNPRRVSCNGISKTRVPGVEVSVNRLEQARATLLVSHSQPRCAARAAPPRAPAHLRSASASAFQLRRVLALPGPCGSPHPHSCRACAQAPAVGAKLCACRHQSTGGFCGALGSSLLRFDRVGCGAKEMRCSDARGVSDDASGTGRHRCDAISDLSVIES